MIKAVLFDLDGTLVNSLEDLAGSTNYALSECGFPIHKTESFKYFVGDGMQKLIERVLPPENRDLGTHKKVFDMFFSHYKVHFSDKTVVYNGIKELLQELKNNGIRLAVISNKAEEMAIEVTKKLFGDTFDFVYGKKEAYPAKPCPDLTLKLISELKVLPEECLLVGDSGMDMATAQNAGCIGVGVLWGFRGKEELIENGAAYTVSQPNEIIEIINEK